MGCFLDGDTLAVGAHLSDDNGSNSGSVYSFERTGNGEWLEAEKLLPTAGEAFALFGIALSLDGDRLAAGEPLSGEGGSISGSVYIFERSVDGSWLEISKSSPLGGQESDSFGISVSLDGDRLAIGASGDEDNGSESGSAYVFDTVLVSPQLTLSGTCPGEIQITSTGTTPRSGARLYRSTAPGTWVFDGGPCDDTVLDLDAPILMGEGNTDFDPEESRTRTVSASECGTYLQTLDTKTCLTSNVVQIP